MEISRLAAENLKHEYQVVVPANDIEKKVTSQLSVVGKTAKMPGFRPGKVPAAILKQQYGLEAREETLRQFVTDAIRQITKDNEFRQATQPQVQIESMENGSDFSFKVIFELLPTIELKDFKEIVLEKLVVDVTDETVQERLDLLVTKHKSYEKLETPRPVEAGDLVHCDVLNKPVLDGNTLKDFPTHIDIVAGATEHLVSGELEQLIVGKNVDDILDISETYPENANLRELSNKELKLNLKITKIEKPIHFELDDNFARDLKCDDLNDLKKRVREVVERELVDLSRMKLKRHLLDELAQSYTFDLPNSLVESEFNIIWKRLQDELTSVQARGNLEQDDDRTEEQLKKEYQAISERRVRLGLIISEVSRLNNIKVEEFEIRQAIYREAMNFPNQVQEVLKFFEKNSHAVDQIAAPILEDKVVDFILGKVELTEKKVSAPELFKAVRGYVPGFEAEEDVEAKKVS